MDLDQYSHLVTYLETLVLPASLSPVEQLRLRRQSTYYFIRDGILYRKNQTSPDHPLRVITVKDVELVFHYFHTDSLAGHFGPLRTYQKIQERYFWPDMRKQIYDFVKTCDVCQRRGKPYKYQEPLHPLSVGQPFDRIGIDLLGPLPKTTRGNRYIVVATDYLTKWPEAQAVPDQSAASAAQFLYEHVVVRHGAPREILSDRGKTFVNRLLNHLCDQWNMTQRFASAYHPQTNGLVERYNKTLAETLARISARQPKEWDELIPAALFAYRTGRHDTTKRTPFYLMYGREAAYPIESTVLTYPREAIDNKESKSDALVRRTFELFGPLEEARQEARTNIRRDQAKQQKRYNKKVRPTTYQVGDLVLRYQSAKAATHSGKLEPKWEGPFTVQAVMGKGVYRLEDSDGSIVDVPVHVQRLKRYHLRRHWEPMIILDDPPPEDH